MISAALVCRSFLGRDAERAFVRDRLEAVRRGEGGVVAIAGPEGCGKTRFLTELRGEMPAGVRVLHAACYGFAPAPYAPFSQILRELGGDDGRRLPDAARVRTRLAPIVPEFADDAAGVAAQRETFAAVERTLRAAAADGLVLVIEDLHDADAGTLDLLRYLVGEMDGARLAVVASYRDDDVPPPFAAVRGALERSPRWRRLALGPLADDAIDALIVEVAAPARLPRYERERIIAAAEGSPLLAEELVRSALEEPGAIAPRTIRDSVRARLDALDPAARRVLAVASQAAAGIDGPTLAALLPDFTPSALALAIDAALGAGLLHRDSRDPSIVGFRHVLMRDAVAAGLFIPDAAAINAVLADRLAAEPVPQLAQIAVHRARSGDRPAASAAWEAAADQAARRFAHADAAEWYRLALAGESEVTRRLSLLRRRADELRRSGDGGAAAADLDAAAALARAAHDDEALGHVLVQFARSAYLGGKRRAATRAYREAIELARSRADRLLGFRATSGLAELCALGGDVASARAALDEAESLGLPEQGVGLVIYHVASAHLAALGGDEERWRAHASAASDAVHTLAVPDVDEMLAVAIDTGAQAASLGLFEQAITFGERATASARTYRMFGDLGAALTVLADAYLAVGRVDDARAAVREAIRASSADEVDALHLASSGVLVAVAAGDAALLAALPDPLRALDRAAERGESARLLSVAAAAASAAVSRGDRAAAEAAIRRGLDACPLAETTTAFLVDAARYGAPDDLAAFDAALAAGDGPKPVSSFGRAHLDLVRALVARRRGDAPGATAYADRALPVFVRLGAKLDAAHARAAIDPREGDRAYHALGVAYAAAVADDAVKRKRAGGRLSERETEIADLVAGGATNKEIGAALHLSERTVEHHVAAILQKLALRRRVEIAARRGDGW